MTKDLQPGEVEAQNTYLEHLMSTGLSWETANILLESTWPKLENISGANEAESTFLVTAKPLASCLGSLLSGDMNAFAHTKQDGFTQTTVIIGMCAAVASRMLPGFRLGRISPDVHFKRALPLGAPIKMKAFISKQGSRSAILTLSGYIGEALDDLMFWERKLLMVRVAIDH